MNINKLMDKYMNLSHAIFVIVDKEKCNTSNL